MEDSSQIKRIGKSLLVAALGVASVSFVGACAPDGADGEEDGVDPPADEVDQAEPRAKTQALNAENVAVSATAAATGTTIVTPLPPSGNLMAPHDVPREVVLVDKLKAFEPIPPSGNLMATPQLERLTEIAQQAAR